MTATVTPIKPKEALDLDILAALDFEPSPPCEHSRHHDHHVPDEFAAYVIHVKCPGCQDEKVYNICESGRHRLLTMLTGCNICGLTIAGSGFVLACTPLNSAS